MPATVAVLGDAYLCRVMLIAMYGCAYAVMCKVIAVHVAE
jgi:hypothetical protein